MIARPKLDEVMVQLLVYARLRRAKSQAPSELLMRIIRVFGLLALTSCAEAPPPIVDMAGKDPIKVNRDMAECREHAYDHVQVIPPRTYYLRAFSSRAA
jgi:hypothetical protein